MVNIVNDVNTKINDVNGSLNAFFEKEIKNGEYEFLEWLVSRLKPEHIVKLKPEQL